MGKVLYHELYIVCVEEGGTSCECAGTAIRNPAARTQAGRKQEAPGMVLRSQPGLQMSQGLREAAVLVFDGTPPVLVTPDVVEAKQ